MGDCQAAVMPPGKKCTSRGGTRGARRSVRYAAGRVAASGGVRWLSGGRCGVRAFWPGVVVPPRAVPSFEARRTGVPTRHVRRDLALVASRRSYSAACRLEQPAGCRSGPHTRPVQPQGVPERAQELQRSSLPRKGKAPPAERARTHISPARCCGSAARRFGRWPSHKGAAPGEAQHNCGRTAQV